ncbi:Rer1 family protein [Schizosaccharomyces cryophilus OY26]|uniref:Protein RER1 n=1 Tax=Schizosaccharomyces cryophilus (strain OY26 / ATCC MYA-4695 / CBS 11777 / NBRC 106824 / NRRL Y48691) TaxID=653667 RepID=S9XG27_SCHCR|nr:Rer1 family protein [Schizosaccharomyces cryophilus OY26]EPY52606.1 Rer1 family protein [Schizosaccharomyces cryophilus OY26]
MESIQNAFENVQERRSALGRQYQFWVDRTIPFTNQRWMSFAGLLSVFVIRILIVRGWYIVCYTLGIYLLNLFLLFLSPKFDPSLEQAMRDEETEEGVLPTTKDDEFRPFIRRLPEFKFWYSSTRATVMALAASMFRIFDIPVFWPVLVVYYFVLSFFCFRRQLQHMLKYRYVPFDIGKRRFSSR